MAKSKYNESALRYAMDYLDRILDLEDYVETRVEEKLDQIMERKLAQEEREISDAIVTHTLVEKNNQSK